LWWVGVLAGLDGLGVGGLCWVGVLAWLGWVLGPVGRTGWPRGGLAVAVWIHGLGGRGDGWVAGSRPGTCGRLQGGNWLGVTSRSWAGCRWSVLAGGIAPRSLFWCVCRPGHIVFTNSRRLRSASATGRSLPLRVGGSVGSFVVSRLSSSIRLDWVCWNSELMWGYWFGAGEGVMSGDQAERSAAVAPTRSYEVEVSGTAETRFETMHGRVVGGTAIDVGRLIGDVKAALHIEYGDVVRGAAVPRSAVVRVASGAAVAAVRDRWGDVGGRGVRPFGAACRPATVSAAVDDAIRGSHVHVADELVVERVARVAVVGALGELERWLAERADAVRRAADRDLRDARRRVGRQRAPQPALAEDRGRGEWG